MSPLFLQPGNCQSSPPNVRWFWPKLIVFYLDGFQLLADDPVVLVHFLHGVAEVVEVGREFLQLFGLALVDVTNIAHTRIYHSL